MKRRPTALPYENATAGARAMRDIEKTLERFGCSQVGHMIDHETAELRVYFAWQGRRVDLRACWEGYAQKYLEAHPYTHRMHRTREQYGEQATHIARKAVYSMLRDWVKGQVTAVETGLMSFETAFVAHMLLPDGSRLCDHEPTKLLERLQ